MAVLVQMCGREKGEHVKEAEGGQWQVVSPAFICICGFCRP